MRNQNQINLGLNSIENDHNQITFEINLTPVAEIINSDRLNSNLISDEDNIDSIRGKFTNI